MTIKSFQPAFALKKLEICIGGRFSLYLFQKSYIILIVTVLSVLKINKYRSVTFKIYNKLNKPQL